MILINIPDPGPPQPGLVINVFYEYRTWLNDHAGTNGPDSEDTLKDWDWHRGDMFARGVYIRDPEIATLFRLTFGI